MSCNKSLPGRQTGLTLIELIITIAVFIVVASTAGPAIQNVMRDNRTVAQVNGLLGDLNFTRSEAIKRGTAVTICQSDNPDAAPPPPADASASCSNDKNGWNKGWIVVDGAGKLLRVHGALRGGTTLTYSRGNLSYKGDGTSTGLANGTFIFCSSAGAGSRGRSLVVGPTGRVRKQNITCS